MTPRGLPKSHSQAPLFLYVPPVRLTWGPSSPRAIANAAGLLLGGDVASISALLRWSTSTTLIEVNWRPDLTIQNGLFVS